MRHVYFIRHYVAQAVIPKSAGVDHRCLGKIAAGTDGIERRGVSLGVIVVGNQIVRVTLGGPASDAENSDAYERDSVEQSLQKWGHSAFSLMWRSCCSCRGSGLGKEGGPSLSICTVTTLCASFGLAELGKRCVSAEVACLDTGSRKP